MDCAMSRSDLCIWLACLAGCLTVHKTHRSMTTQWQLMALKDFIGRISTGAAKRSNISIKNAEEKGKHVMQNAFKCNLSNLLEYNLETKCNYNVFRAICWILCSKQWAFLLALSNSFYDGSRLRELGDSALVWFIILTACFCEDGSGESKQ